MDGFSREVSVNHQQGCDVRCKDVSNFSSAIDAAKKSDATVILAGIDLSVESEGHDRDDLMLPGYQVDFITQVAQASKGPVVLVILSGGPVGILFAKNNSKIHAILWAGYPGEEGGRAIADVVFGRYNPSNY